MNRRLVGLLAAAALAAVGTVILVGYVRSAEARALEGERLVEVLVVTDDVEGGTPAADLKERVRVDQVPTKVRAAGAVNDLGELKGLVAAVDLVAGEQLLKDRFVEPEVQKRGDLPAGMLQVTIALEPQRALGGRIAAGDTVGVVASFDRDDTAPATTHLILHKVLVTGVQADEELPKDDGDAATPLAPSGKLLVTLAVDAPSAERVVFAAEHGRVWLTAEPSDAKEDGSQVQTRGSVFA